MKTGLSVIRFGERMLAEKRGSWGKGRNAFLPCLSPCCLCVAFWREPTHPSFSPIPPRASPHFPPQPPSFTLDSTLNRVTLTSTSEAGTAILSVLECSRILRAWCVYLPHYPHPWGTLSMPTYLPSLPFEYPPRWRLLIELSILDSSPPASEY